MKAVYKNVSNYFNGEVLFFGGMYKVSINGHEDSQLYKTKSEAVEVVDNTSVKISHFGYRYLQGSIIRKVENGLISPQTARGQLAPYSKFLYEEYNGVYDLAEHLYKMVDLSIMPYGVMIEIMRGSESYYGEKWA